MAKSLTIIRLAGVPIRLHWTLAAIPVFFLYQPLLLIRQAPQWMTLSLIQMGLLTLAILMHETAHALTAAAYGASVEEIVFTPIGGWTKVHNMPSRPWAHVGLSVSGPAANFAVAAVAFAIAGSLQPKDGSMAGLAHWNLVLGAFNIVPAQPLDGGQALRYVLRSALGYIRGDLWAGRAGIVIAVILIAAGVSINSVLIIVVGVITAAASYNLVKQSKFLLSEPYGLEMTRDWQLPSQELDDEIIRRRKEELAHTEMTSRVDQILRHISDSGYDSLSEEEKEFLQKASERLRMNRSSD